jgi:hypothetical protein
MIQGVFGGNDWHFTSTGRVIDSKAPYTSTGDSSKLAAIALAAAIRSAALKA